MERGATASLFLPCIMFITFLEINIALSTFEKFELFILKVNLLTVRNVKL